MLTAASITAVTAAQRWAGELAAWTIDPDILAAAPESPYGFPPELFAVRDDAESPLLDLARAAMPAGATVLDVGAGAGAGSLGLAGTIGHLHAVDEQPSMLRALLDAAHDRGVPATTYAGVWPEVADRVPVCNVVVCAHVAYNVPDLARFALALSAHARSRVLLELAAEHPWVPLGPLWEHFHGQLRPAGPTAELAVDVLLEVGIGPGVHRWSRPPVRLTDELLGTYVAFTRRRLCLPSGRDPEVAELLARQPREPRESVVLVWDV